MLLYIIAFFLKPSFIQAESNLSALHPHPYVPPLHTWGVFVHGAVVIRLSPSLNTPGSRASTASAAAVLAASSRTRHHKSLSTSSHPSPPDLHAHRPRQVAAIAKLNSQNLVGRLDFESQGIGRCVFKCLEQNEIEMPLDS